MGGEPTSVVLLMNVVGAGEVDEDLHDEIVDEANKFGKLVKCTIKEMKGVVDEQAVRIFLQYELVDDAIRACDAFYARYFGGRSVRARYYDLDSFLKGDLKDDSMTQFKSDSIKRVRLTAWTDV